MSSAEVIAAWLDEAFQALRPAARPLVSSRVGDYTLRQWATRPDQFADQARLWRDPGAPTRHTDSTVDVILAPLSDLPPDLQPPPVAGDELGANSEAIRPGQSPARLLWDESQGLLLVWHAERGHAVCLTGARVVPGSTAPVLPLVRWLVEWAGGLLVNGACVAPPQPGATESRGALLLDWSDEDRSRVVGAARSDGWAVWGAGSVAVFPDERGWSAVALPGTAGQVAGQVAAADADNGQARMRVTGLVLLDSDGTTPPRSSAEPARDAGASRAQSSHRIGQMCAELPVRTMRVGEDSAAAVAELGQWLADSRPRVSAVIPVRNGARYLRRSISSIINQQGARFQIIAVDDGSTDSSLSVLVALLPEVIDAGHELTITQHREELGGAAAIATGAAAAIGEYLAFLDQQDEWLPGRTEVLLTALRRGAQPAAAGAVERVSDQDELTDWARPDWFGEASPGNVAGALLVRRSALDEVVRLGGGSQQVDDGTELLSRLRDAGAVLDVPAVVLRRWVRSSDRPVSLREQGRGHLRLVRDR